MPFVAAIAVWLLNIAGLVVAMAGVATHQPLLGFIGGSMTGFVSMIAAFLLHQTLRYGRV